MNITASCSFLFPLCSPGARAYSNAYFGEGQGSINLDSVQCSGSEYNLTECVIGSSGSGTSHSMDVGVKCQPGMYNEAQAIFCCKLVGIDVGNGVVGGFETRYNLGMAQVVTSFDRQTLVKMQRQIPPLILGELGTCILCHHKHCLYNYYIAPASNIFYDR